jgi:lipoprotein-anchoring transpeptidase ErfK/SrfK
MRLIFLVSIFKIYYQDGRLLVVEKFRTCLLLTIAAGAAVLLGTISVHAAGMSTLQVEAPITAGDAQRQHLQPPPPYETLPHEDYVEPSESPTALPTPASEARPAASASATVASIQQPSAKSVDDGPTPGQLAYRRTRDLSYADPLSWSVMVYKKRHVLIVYYKGRRYQTYHAVFGRNLDDGTKEYEGDRRTPEGVYTIVEKHPSSRWEWFLTLNYPNLVDRLRYYQLVDSDIIPVHNGHVVGVGGRIGIHGTDEPVLNRGNVNWTTGCISVDDDTIEKLHKLLPIGTIVIIGP